MFFRKRSILDLSLILRSNRRHQIVQAHSRCVAFPKVVRHSCTIPLFHCFLRTLFRYWQVSVLMPSCRLLSSLRAFAFILVCCFAGSMAQAQAARQTIPQSTIADADADHVKERNEWFF